jgi:hypothetical protein
VYHWPFAFLFFQLFLVLLCSVLLCVVCIVLRMLEIEVRSEDGSHQLKLGELETKWSITGELIDAVTGGTRGCKTP